MKDYYKILEVNPSATSDEIKKSYRRLALKFHPDKNPNDKIAENCFKDIVEAYETLGNSDLRKNYDQKTTQNQKAEKPKEKPITPIDIQELFSNTRKKVVNLGKAQINASKLFESLNDLLSENIIKFLLISDDVKTNKLIMNDVLICCKYLPYDKAEKLILKLVKVAGSDNNTISSLHKFNKKLKLWNTWDQYKGFAIIGAIILFFIIAFNISDNTPMSGNSPSNGDLNSSFTNEENNPDTTTQINKSPDELLEEKKNQLIADGWEKQSVENGQLSSCYNFKPKRGKINNYLDVYVGSGTDVSIKLMNSETEKCVRYVFINSGTSYRIKNIPQGNYYLKIAYGKDWFSKIENGQCIGKFLRNSMYEKGQDIMNFNVKYTSEGYNIPSFKLDLDVIASDVSNSFNSQNISEDEFNQ